MVLLEICWNTFKVYIFTNIMSKGQKKFSHSLVRKSIFIRNTPKKLLEASEMDFLVHIAINVVHLAIVDAAKINLEWIVEKLVFYFEFCVKS